MAKAKPADMTSDRAQAAIDSALRTLDAEGGGIDALATALRDGLGSSFAAAIDLIRAAQGRVIVTGMGKSGHVGRKIASTFSSTGTPALFVHPGEASHGDLGMIANNDVIIALSWSGETAELKNLTDYSRRFRIGLIAMTASADSTLAKTADVVLALPQAREACPHNLAPTTSSLMQLALGDALAIALLGKPRLHRGRFRPAASGRQARRAAQGGRRLHARRRVDPAGAARHAHGRRDPRDVGQGLRLRRHHRCRAASWSASSPTATCAATCATICSTARVDDVMTRAPKTVRPDQLISETLEILNSTKVTALFAVEAGKPVGVIHIHDLLRAGAA